MTGQNAKGAFVEITELESKGGNPGKDKYRERERDQNSVYKLCPNPYLTPEPHMHLFSQVK